MRVLFRDDHLLAVDKPSGLAVHRGWADDDDTAVDRVRALVGRPVSPVHRLDRATSGVLLFALSSDAASALCAAFAEGGPRKRYLAAVRGLPAEEGLIDHPVRRGEERDAPRVPARTAFVRLATTTIPDPDAPFGSRRYSLVEARPETGRLHQIRRHMKHVSHPIVGDVRYGKREHNHFCRDRFGLARMALHARELSLDHPVTGARLVIAAELPSDLATPLAAMGFAPVG